MNVSQGDLHDFNEVLKRNKQLEADFSLDCTNEAIKDRNDRLFIESEYVVLRKSTQIEKRYDAGPGTLWLEQFEHDIQHSFFDKE
ncbi:MAG: hypothetical protein PSV35_10760 [bacterium]|nr:hypothetical protein [bacterium]